MKRKRFAMIGALLCAIAMQAHAATITVTNRNDSGPGSLRRALGNANNGDRINFGVSGTITLTSGGLSIAKNVTISGPGANQLSINGNQAPSVFAVAFERTVAISGLTITNGGVGIWNQQGTLTVSNCVLSGNSFAALYNNYAAQGSGGASMTVANSIISNNSGTGAVNMFPFFLYGGPSGFPCSCMTITDSVVSNNTDGIFNFGFDRSGTANLTVVNSNVSDNEGTGISNSSAGFNGGAASLTVVNSTVSDNGGSGISNDTNESSVYATIVSTTVSGNSASGVLICGCGAFGGFAGVTITNSTISGNSTGDSGGGIHARGITYLTVANSTISGNSAGTSGGGIYAGGFAANVPDRISIVNSTISGNSVGTSGGGIYNAVSVLHVANSTISGNSAGSGGGIYNSWAQFGEPGVEISNTIFNAGASGENIFNDGGTVSSDGYNLSSDDGGGYLNGPADQINTDPLLGPLQGNGGPTLTHALLPGSPAIDKGNSSGAHVDQRGFHRPIDLPGIPNPVGGDGSDIGAFEFGSFSQRGDFNSDGFTDYLLFNGGNRATLVWYLHNNTFIGGAYGPSIPTGWTVADVADFNGDGLPDYALFNANTRQTGIWYLKNTLRVGSSYGPTLPSGWQLAAVGDFNGDSKPDYVLYNASTRQTAIWYLNNNVFVSSAVGPTIASAYVLSGVADFDGDGKPDYLLYNAGTRQTAIWYLNNNVFVSGVFGPTIASAYVLSGVADFDGDGKPDYLLYNAGTHQTAIWYLNDNTFLRGAFGPILPAGWTLVAP